MKRQNEAKLLQLSTTIQNNLQKLMSSTFQRTLQENVIIKSEVRFFILTKVISYTLKSLQARKQRGYEDLILPQPSNVF